MFVSDVYVALMKHLILNFGREREMPESLFNEVLS